MVYDLYGYFTSVYTSIFLWLCLHLSLCLHECHMCKPSLGLCNSLTQNEMLHTTAWWRSTPYRGSFLALSKYCNSASSGVIPLKGRKNIIQCYLICCWIILSFWLVFSYDFIAEKNTKTWLIMPSIYTTWTVIKWAWKSSSYLSLHVQINYTIIHIFTCILHHKWIYEISYIFISFS